MSILELRVRFPIGAFTNNLLDEMPERHRGQFPDDDFRALEISLHDGVFVEVDGFGLPFHNPGHDADDWINKGSVVADSMTFIDILQQRKWHIIVKHPYKYFGRLWEDTMVPAPFTFPYGNEHWFDLLRYETQFKEAVSKGSQFPISVNCSDVSSMQAVVTQSTVQCHLKIAMEVAKIFAKRLRVSFIPSEQYSRLFAIVSMEGPYCQATEKTWSEITKQGLVRLALHEDKSSMDTPKLIEHKQWHKLAAFICDARIVDKTEAKFIPELKDYPLTSLDLVLVVRRPKDSKVLEHKKGVQKSIGDALAWLRIRTFPTDLESWDTVSLLFDPQLDDLERKIKAVNQYSLSPVSSLPKNGPKMITHTVFQLGRGFLNRLNRAGTWDLPMVNILDLDSRLLDCLMEEISDENHGRFRQYMGHLSVGFGIITAAPGFGKTCTLGVASLGMTRTLGKIYVSAPTLAAVDNFARRIDMLDQKVVARHNNNLTKNHQQMPIRRKLIIRGLSMNDEIEALDSLLQRAEDNAEALEAVFQDIAKGRFYLSAAYWLLKVLGSPAVPAIDERDHASIKALHKRLETDPLFSSLVVVARRKLPWTVYARNASNRKESLMKLFQILIEEADMVCTTPEEAPYRQWKTTRAKGITIDEATGMGRPDLYCVWGNTFLPCLLAGDDEYFLPPAPEDKDEDGNSLDRHAEDSKLSALAFYKANSWPVYRLHSQLRMARGMFDLCHEMFYSHLPLEYAETDSERYEQVYRNGVNLEAFLKERFPNLSSLAPNTMEPVFVHCPNSQTDCDSATGSMSNSGQCEVALQLLVDLVNDAKIDPAQLSIITPYKANVAIMERWILEKLEYSMLRCVAPATVESYQGREADIVCVVMGTTRNSGPGLTRDEDCLKAMLSRHRSGLIIIGDIKLAALDVKKTKWWMTSTRKGKRKAKNEGQPDFGCKIKYLQDGKTRSVKAETLRKVYWWFQSRGRKIEIAVPEEGGKKEACEEDQDETSD